MIHPLHRYRLQAVAVVALAIGAHCGSARAAQPVVAANASVAIHAAHRVVLLVMPSPSLPTIRFHIRGLYASTHVPPTAYAALPH